MGQDLITLSPVRLPREPNHRLPLLPDAILRRRHCLEETDSRFRAGARLMQALWREERGLPIGYHTDPNGRRRKLGSRVSVAAARSGANFLTPEVAHLVRRECVYREIGAFIDEHRLLGNLLSSQPMCFNLFAPLKLNLQLATGVLECLLPHFEGEVVQVLFEHSPGRGDPRYLADYSAFDALIQYRNPAGGRGFVAIETKFTESMQEPVPAPRPRYDELSRSSQLYVDPDGPQLRSNPLQQLWREHLLAQAMLDQGLYDEGTFVLIAPTLNHLAQNAAGAYRCQLEAADLWQARFDNITLEHVIGAIEAAGAPEYARALHGRYCDWHQVDRQVDLHGWGQIDDAEAPEIPAA